MREEALSEDKRRKVILVGVDIGGDADFEHSMKELKGLAEACNKQVAGIITQRLQAVNKALYIGAGKVEEVKEFAKDAEADEIIFDNVLSPSQIRNLGRELELPVMDRTSLILDIFDVRAQTREAKLQVEAARLQYMLPRLVGLHESLGRQGGASGSMSNKGVGEKKLELDRRKIEYRMGELRRELEEIAKNRVTRRKRRSRSGIPQVALVGYTNAGKSTILNHMVKYYGSLPEKQVTEKDMLFATLDTSVRRIDAGDNRFFFLTDTVGFIHKLPHGLIQAFRSTLEEIKYADLLVHVVDFSDENYKHQMEVTRQTLEELDAGNIPQIVVYNKADKCQMQELPRISGEQIYMAAGKNIGIRQLAEMIKSRLYAEYMECQFLIPYDKGRIVSYFMENALVRKTEYAESGIRLLVNCNSQDAAKYAIFRV